MTNKYSMKRVWMRGIFTMMLMCFSSIAFAEAASSSTALGFESTHAQTQAVGLARTAIAGAFVIGVIGSIWGVIQFSSVNNQQTPVSEKLSSLKWLFIGVALIGIGGIIEFNTGAFLGSSAIDAPTGIPDDLW